jgi:hypothetical protein
MNKEEKAAYDKVYYIKNRAHRRATNKIYNKTYRPQRNKFVLSTWEGYLPLETECESCGKPIFFNKQNRKDSIHFDHKDERNASIRPTNWLADHIRTPETELVWKSFNFGNLCKKCNSFLPTKNREQYVRGLVKYVFGKEYIITKGK